MASSQERLWLIVSPDVRLCNQNVECLAPSALSICLAASQRAWARLVPPSILAGEDGKLLSRIAAGDRQALGLLYDRHSIPLYSLALRILGDKSEAQDVIQEVFLTVWNNARALRSERGSTFSWIAMQVRHRAIDRLRADHRHAKLSAINAPDLVPDDSFSLTSQLPDQNERARGVHAALSRLSYDQRQVLRLAFFEGLTQIEIADRLQEPLGAVKAGIVCGLKRLRVYLKTCEASRLI